MLLAPQTAHVTLIITGGLRKPVGIATQKKHLRARLIVDEAAQRLARFFNASVDLMKILARACGHTHLDQFELRDLTTWKRDVAYLTGVPYGGVTPL